MDYLSDLVLYSKVYVQRVLSVMAGKDTEYERHLATRVNDLISYARGLESDREGLLKIIAHKVSDTLKEFDSKFEVVNEPEQPTPNDDPSRQ